MKLAMKSALAAVALGAAVSAHAVAPATVPADNRLFISGATATDAALFELGLVVNGGACTAGTIDVYRAFDNEGEQNQILTACTASAGVGLTGDILIAKESNGGSGNGTGVVARGDALDFLNPDAVAGNCDAPVTVPGTTDPDTGAPVLNAYELHDNCSAAALFSFNPKVGIADVEAALFLDTDATVIDALIASPLFQILFAPAVSENLYRALQRAQGLTENDDEANVPSLTRGQLSAIFSGQVAAWNVFRTSPNSTTNPGGPFADASTNTAAAIGQPTIFVCRRGQTSGTQASFASFVLNERCNSSVPQFRSPTAPALNDPQRGSPYDASFDPFPVFAGASSGEVRACLDAKNDTGRYGIGVLSTNTSIGDANRQIRFVGVDGIAPTLQNVANGGYHFVTENVLNTATTQALSNTGRAALTGGETAIRNFIRDNIGNPDIIRFLNVSSRNPGGDHGILGSPGTGALAPWDPAIIDPNTGLPQGPATQDVLRASPISSFTRGGNNCRPQASVSNAQIIGGQQ